MEKPTELTKALDEVFDKERTVTIRSTRFFHKPKKKVFYVDWKKNAEGEFLKITEVSDGKRDTIVIPDNKVDAFVHAIAKVKGLTKGGE